MISSQMKLITKAHFLQLYNSFSSNTGFFCHFFSPKLFGIIFKFINCDTSHIYFGLTFTRNYINTLQSILPHEEETVFIHNRRRKPLGSDVIAPVYLSWLLGHRFRVKAFWGFFHFCENLLIYYEDECCSEKVYCGFLLGKDGRTFLWMNLNLPSQSHF